MTLQQHTLTKHYNYSITLQAMTSRKMPHNNRVSASVALKTNSIWTKTIGYDPYAAKVVENLECKYMDTYTYFVG